MDEEKLLVQLTRGDKYGKLDPGLLRRVAAMMAPRYNKEKDALDAAKRHLHIICGMYQGTGEQAKLSVLMRDALREQPDPERVRRLAEQVLPLHASTRERMPWMKAFYEAVFGKLPVIRSVADLGCGLHPFARPFMQLGTDCRYDAWDLLPETAVHINAFFAWAGYAGMAGVLDLAVAAPSGPVDLAFALKLLPVLEQQHKGRGGALLSALPARYAAVTFPTRTMGGRKQGMAGFYADWMSRHLGPWRVLLEQEIGNELLFLLIRNGQTKEEINP